MKKENVKEENRMADEDASIEEIFGRLDEVIEKLTEGEISLEESFKFYESGMKLVKTCNDKIDKVEKQILVLNEGNNEA